MTRTRSTVLSDTTQVGNYQNYSATQSGPLIQVSSGTISGSKTYQYKEITDVNNPGFHKRKRDGHLEVNPLSIHTLSHDWGGFEALYGETYSKSWGKVTSRTSYSSPLPVNYNLSVPSFTVDQDLIDDLVNKATVEVWSQKVDPEFALGVAVAEGRETLSYLLGILQAVRNPLKKLREEVRTTGHYVPGMDLRKVAWNSSGDLSNIWLSFRYGLMPIYYDIRDFLEADLVYTERMRQTYRRSEANVSMTESAYSVTANTTWRTRTYADVKAHAGLTVDYYWENRADFLRHVLGLNNPLDLLWELTRLSFVVDWFVNIGETIKSHTPSASVLQEIGWVSLRKNIRIELEANFYYRLENSTTITTWPGNFATPSVFTLNSMDRSLLEDPPFFPQISVNLDGYKFVDLAALVRSMTTL